MPTTISCAAWRLFISYTAQGNAEALKLFSDAIELDPDFAAAYGMAARCYLQRKDFGWVDDREREMRNRATGAASRRSRTGRRARALHGGLCTRRRRRRPGRRRRSRREGRSAQSEFWHGRGTSAPSPRPGWASLRSRSSTPRAPFDSVRRTRRCSPCEPLPHSVTSSPRVTTRLLHPLTPPCASSPISSLDKVSSRPAARLRIGYPKLKKAMANLRRLNPALRISNLKNLLPFARHEDFDRWAEGLRRAGLPE